MATYFCRVSRDTHGQVKQGTRETSVRRTTLILVIKIIKILYLGNSLVFFTKLDKDERNSNITIAWTWDLWILAVSGYALNSSDSVTRIRRNRGQTKAHPRSNSCVRTTLMQWRQRRSWAKSRLTSPHWRRTLQHCKSWKTLLEVSKDVNAFDASLV